MGLRLHILHGNVHENLTQGTLELSTFESLERTFVRAKLQCYLFPYTLAVRLNTPAYLERGSYSTIRHCSSIPSYDKRRAVVSLE